MARITFFTGLSVTTAAFTRVAKTPEQYREIALDLYRDRRRLDSLRKRLEEAKQAAPLFDMARFTENLEEVYARMWENHRSGKRQQILANCHGRLQGAAERRA